MPYSQKRSNLKSEYTPKTFHLAIKKRKKRKVVFTVLFWVIIVFALGYQAYALSECNHYLSAKNKELNNTTSEYEAKKVMLESKLDENGVYSKAVKYGMRKADSSQYITVLPKTETKISKTGFFHNIKEFFINFYNNIIDYFWYR